MKRDEREASLGRAGCFPMNPMLLIRDALRSWLLVAVVAGIVGMLAFVQARSSYVPRYETSCTLVVSTRESSATIYDQLDAASRLAEVFTEVLNSSVMRSNILHALQMDSFSGLIHASAVESTNLLTVQVTAGDPRTAFAVMRVLLEQHGKVTYAVMGDIVLEILEPPVVPTEPCNAVDGTRAVWLAVAAGAAMFGLLVLRACLRDVVRNPQEAQQKLACRCLGQIRHERKRHTFAALVDRRKRGILISDSQTSLRYVSDLRKLARRVAQHMQAGKALLVTSVLENEGKTTVAANLALALALGHSRVLLVDGDLRKPACRKIMDMAPGASSVQNVIRGTAELSEAVVTDPRSGVRLLMAEQSASEQADLLLSGQGMAQLLDQARAQYDYVVIDLAHMSAAPDAEAIMELVDAGLLVIRQNAASVPELNRAIEDLQRGRGKLLGCVINDVPDTAESYRRRYGYTRKQYEAKTGWCDGRTGIAEYRSDL